MLIYRQYSGFALTQRPFLPRILPAPALNSALHDAAAQEKRSRTKPVVIGFWSTTSARNSFRSYSGVDFFQEANFNASADLFLHARPTYPGSGSVQPATQKRDGLGVVALGHELPPLFGALRAGHVKCLVVQEELSFEVSGLSLAARADSLSLRKSASMKAAGEYMHRMHLTFSINKKGDTWKR